MRTALLLLGLVCYATAYYKIQSERGVDTSIHWAPTPYHILHQGSGVPRSIDVKITFQKRFIQKPQILLGTTHLDWENGQPAGFDIEILETTLDGFTIRVSALTSKAVYAIQVQWFAFFDPNLEVIRHVVAEADLPRLSSGQNVRRNQDWPFTFKNKYTEVPQLAYFLNGVQFIQRYNVLTLSTFDVTPLGFKLRASTYGTTKVIFFRANIIVGPISTLYAQATKFKITDYSHPWSIRQPPSDRAIDASVPITSPKFQTGERFDFVGFSGVEIEDQSNTRVYIRNIDVGRNEMRWAWGTWWDSFIWALEANAFLYVPDKSTKIFPPGCAEVFSECNYEGDSITICDRVTSFPKSGWNKPVKSFFVPKGMVLKVFDKEDLKGQVLRIEQSEECIEQVQFTFAQLLANYAVTEE